ncbi:VIR protein [Plasmodium vivax]|uniref:VIR protein n=1 Tax=Plasmodium vivax TaxID=5855 RepID=A0A1G4HJL4_PLAVI|nr:VIR protein [Plasmodium vivax]
MSQQNECSKLLPSLEFYNELNTEPGYKLVYRYFCHTIESLTSDRKYIDLCYKIVRYLTVNASDNNEIILCNHCKLLNYWTFEQIKRIYGEDKKQINIAYGHISHVVSNIMRLYYESKKSHCTLDFQVPHDDNWEAKKEFYEYCQDYNEINKRKQLTDPECEKYGNYLKTKKHLLAKLEQILSDNNLKNCPNSDAETGGCDPNALLAELSQKKDFLETKNDLPDESSKLFLGLSKKDTATAASAIGVSLLGLTLFKFTPLGTWSNRGKQGTNNVIYNLGENNMNELLPSELQPPNMEYDAAAYYLPYNSA